MCRTVGNQIPPYGPTSDFSVASSIEYALGASEHLAAWLRHEDAARSVVCENYEGESDSDLLLLLSEENVLAQIALASFPSTGSESERHLTEMPLELFGASSMLNQVRP